MAKTYNKGIRKALIAYENGKVSESRKLISRILRSKALTKLEEKRKKVSKKYFG